MDITPHGHYTTYTSRHVHDTTVHQATYQQSLSPDVSSVCLRERLAGRGHLSMGPYKAKNEDLS